MNGIAEEDGMGNEGKTTLGLGIDPLGVIHGGVMNDGAKPRDPNAPKDGETAEDWINRVRDVAARNDRDARMDYEMVTFLQNRAKDGTTDEEVFKYLDEYSEKRWGLHCDHGSAWNPDDGMHPFESAGDYADAMQRIVRDGWASPVSPSLRAWREAQARGDRAEMIRLAGVLPNKVEGAVFGANGVGGGGTYGGATTRPKTDAEIDEELDEYDAKMAAKDFLGVQRVLDAKWHFDERERRLINAAIDSGDGLPDEAREDFESLAYAAPERAAAVGMLVDLARRRESRWVRDNVVDPICSVAKDFVKGAFAMERGAAEHVMLRAEANAMVRDEAEGGDMDYSPRRIWNERERGEYDRIAATGNLRDAYLTAKKMCVERLVDEMKPAAERRRERLTRTLVEDSVGHQPTVEYNYLSRSVAGVCSMLPYMVLSATPAGFALNVASQFEKVRDDIVRGGGDPDEALGAQLLLATAWAGVEKLQYERLLGKPMSGLRMRMAFANGFCEAWQKKEFREALRRAGTLARQVAKEGAKKGATESLEESVQDALEKGEVTWFTTKDGGKVFADAVKAGATSFCESYLSMAMVGGFGEARNLYRARNASLDNRSLAEFASAENRAMQLYRGNLAELEGTAEQREKNLTARTRKFREECLATVRRHREDGGGLREALAEIRERNGLTDEQTRAIGEWLDMRANVQAMAANTGARERSRLLHGAGMLPVGQDTTYDVANLMRLINPDIKVEEVTLGGKAAPDGAPDAAHPATPTAPIETAKPRMLIDGKSVETKNLRERLAEAERNVANAPDKETRRKADKEARKLRQKLRSSEAADAAEERRQGEQANAAPTTEAVPGETEGTTPATPMAEPATLSPEAVGETATPPAAPQGETATPTPVAEPPPSPTATEPRRGLRITVPLADGTTRSVTLVENHEAPDINTEGAATSVAAAMADMVGAANRAGQTVRGADEITDEEFAALPADKKTAFAVTEKRYMAMGEDERALYWDNNNLTDGGYFMPAAAGNAYGSDGVIMVQRSLGSPFARVGGNWTVSHEYGHAVSRFMRDAGLIGERQIAVLQALFPKRGGSEADELWDEEAANNAFAEWLRDRFDFGLVPEGQREEAEGIFKTAWRVVKTLLGIGGREAPVMERERTRREEAIDAMAEAFRKGDFSGLDAFAEDVDALREKPGAKPAEAEVAEDGAKPAEAVAPHADTPDEEAARNAAGERGAETHTTTPTDGAKPAEGGKSRSKAKPTAKTGAEAEKEAYRRGYEDALAKATADFLAKIADDPEHAKDNLPNRTGARRTLFTPNYAMKVEVEYTWAPLASILESTDDREMQMRDRKNRIATAQQVIENTRPGRFQPLALFMSLTTDTGAPIVGGGMRIISGHGRHQYLLKLDEEGRFNEYLDPINVECARQGLPTAPQGMEKPVLVARVVKGLETIEQAHRFAELSNRSGMLERSGAEYAESDARAITPALMRLYNPDESGNLLSAGNRDFMNAFIRAVGATGLTNADGTPTPEAALRVQRAMMTAIFGGDENVRAMVRQLLEQSQALGLGTVMNALTRSAGRLLALRGRHGDFDIVDDVREATRLYIAWRVERLEQPRLTFAEHLRGQDFFQKNATPMQEALARLLDTGRFGAALAKYVDLAAQEAEDGQGLLGGIVEKRTPLQVMGYAERAILPLKDGATEARTDEDYAEAPVTPHPDSDVAKSAVKVATPPVETKPPETKPAEPVAPAPAEPVKAAEPVKPVAPKPKPAAKKPEPAKPEPTPAEAAAAIVEEDVKPHPFTPQPAKPQSLAPAKHGEKFAFERDGEKTTLPGGAWNHLRVPFKYGKAKDGSALPIPASPQDGRGRGLWAPGYPWGAKDRARRDALLAQWGGRCPKYMGNKNSMTLRTVAAIHDQMSPEERAHYTALNDCFGGGGCWGLTLAMTCFTNVRRITVNEFEEGRLEKIRLMHTLDGEMGDRLRAFLERTDLVEKARKVVLVSADGKVRKATWNGQDCRDRTFAAAREFMDELTADERGLLFALLDNMQSRMQYGAGELVDGKYDFDAMVKAAVSGVAEEAISATEMADAFKARGGSIVYVAGDSKLQRSFGARRDTKRTDAEVYTRGGDGDAYAVEHGDHVVSVCDPPYYRTTGYDNGNKTTVGLAENPMGWGYEDTRAMLRAVVDGGDALVYTDEDWWLNSEYRAETDEGDFMEGDLFGGAFGPTSVYARENAVLQDIVNLLDHFDVAGGVASRQEVLGVHHGHRNDHQSADGAVLRAADDAAGGGLPADGGRVHGRDDQAVGAVDGGDAAQDGAAHGQDAQGDGRGGSGEADAAGGGRHSVRVGAGTAALARAVLARELADEIQREKPHLPRAVAHGAARNAIRARYEAASGVARHSVRAEREYDEVVARYTNADGSKKRGWMLAPNGKPTNLTERQWVQVRTPSFKRWFGDWENDPANASKVVDENGEPKPVYHGTGEDFTVFDIDGRGGGAAYFTPDKDFAASHYGAGAVAMGCFLNVRNLLSAEEAYYKYGVDFSALNEQEIDKTREAVDRVKADGYDGVRGTTFDSDSNEKEAIAVFSPTQIKSATDNTGAFDAGDLDIRHSVRAFGGHNGARFIDLEKGDTFDKIEKSISARKDEEAHNNALGLTAKIESKRNADHLAHKKSFFGDEDDEAHKYAAKNVLALFEMAKEGVIHHDKKGSPTDFIRVFAPFDFAGETMLATVTLKRMAKGDKFYSIEAVETNKTVGSPRSSRTPAQGAQPTVSLRDRIAYYVGDVKATQPKFLGKDEADFSVDELTSRVEKMLTAFARAQAESAGRRDSADAERHSLMFGLPTSGAKMRAKSEAQRLLDEKFHGEYTDWAREYIYVATGWWKGIDGKWRMEIANPTAKKRRGPTKTLPDGTRMVNGLVPISNGTVYGCKLPDICNLPDELAHVPKLTGINVFVVSPDATGMRGSAASWSEEANAIMVNWDSVKWHDDEPTNVLTDEGVANITHELQHVIQDWLHLAGGASWKDHGEENYERSAGEVEARNAERRRTDTTDEDGDASAYADLVETLTVGGREDVEANRETRLNAVLGRDAPWQTEDVPGDEQVITKWDAERGPITTDRMGNLVPRHSVTAGHGGGMRRQDMAVAFLAQRVLAGREATVDEAAAVLKSLGLGALPAGETLAKAKKVAEDNRARLKKETEESSPKVFATLAAANLAEDMGVALDRLITRSSEAVDPEVGRRVQKMAHDHEARSLAAANGFTAAEMAAEMPIDLAQGLLAVKEYEKTPEEKARLEAERAKREEERRRRMEEDDRTDEELLADAEADHLREPTAEERAAFDALMDRARFADEQRKAEEQRRKLADAQRKRNGADGAAEDADGDGEGDGADGADALEAGTLSKETVARIAPVFESAELFAQFLIEWTGDKTLERHPELPATAQMWKSPVAVRELKQTATAILRDLARRALGTPTHNHARNYADHLINELESDAQLKTYASVRRMVARIYGVIHDDALRLTRRQLVDRLVNGWREGETTHMGIRQLAGVKGRFSATAEAAQRAIDGRTEQWARTLVKVIYLSEAKTAQREQELEAIVNFDPTAEDAGDAPTPDAVREAADELAIIRRYGGLRRMMPGQISELSDEILDLLGGKRQAFEAERLEREAKCAKVREAFIAAVGAGRAPKPKGKKNFLVRWLEAFQGNVDLEMRSLYRHCADEAKRQAASDAVDELMVAISEAGSVYRTEAARGRAEVQRGLAAAYGSAEAGIKHLAEPLPPEVADAIFSQSRDLVPTYGHLLQLYASAIQKDYAENVKKHGRDRQLALMRSTLTAGDMAFHAWAAQWYAAGRARLSDAVEAVTGVPVTSPDNCYVPVRVKRPAQGFAAEVSAWSPIPRALSKRVPHALDFDEGADFLSLLLEQVETRAQTIGKAGLGIELRDTLAHRDVQDAVRRSVGAEEMRQVADHLRDIVMEDVGRDRDRTLDLLDLARGWVARFGISGNLKSVMAQPASIPVWGNVMLGGRSIGLGRVAYYLAHVDRDAIAELVESDGFSARYEMGWSEEVQNILKNPSRNRVIRSVERVYDLGMKPSQYADRCATLWVAQGFYRDARQRYLDMGETEAEAKRKALALTWAAVEATQQTGRTEYMNRAQRGRSGSIARAVFQFRTAQLLSNNYLIQALRDARAGTPGAKGRLARAAVISTVVVPAYMMAVSALWDALMGEEPPEDEERWPTLMKEMAWSMVDGVTAPLFVANTLAESTVKPLLGIGGFGSGSGIPALDSTKRLAVHAGKAAKDAAAWLGQNLGAFELEEEMTLDKIMADLGRLAQDAAAPVRQTARALRNWLGREE